MHLIWCMSYKHPYILYHFQSYIINGFRSVDNIWSQEAFKVDQIQYLRHATYLTWYRYWGGTDLFSRQSLIFVPTKIKSSVSKTFFFSSIDNSITKIYFLSDVCFKKTCLEFKNKNVEHYLVVTLFIYKINLCLQY